MTLNSLVSSEVNDSLTDFGIYVSDGIDVNATQIEDALTFAETTTGEDIAVILDGKITSYTASDLMDEGYDVIIELAPSNTSDSANVTVSTVSEEASNVLNSVTYNDATSAEDPTEATVETLFEYANGEIAAPGITETVVETVEVAKANPIDFSALSEPVFLIGAGLAIGLPLTIAAVAHFVALPFIKKHNRILEYGYIAGPGKETQKGKQAEIEASHVHIYHDSVPDVIKQKLLKIDTIGQNERVPATIQQEIDGITDNIQELFERIENRQLTSQQKIVTAEYTDRLTKLDQLLGEGYYLDILANPQLWENAEERITQVETAVKAIDTEIIANIRKVNSSKDLEFNVALNALSGKYNQDTLNKLYTKTPIKERLQP